jgi:putative hydrolase of the HAD superfamily
MLTTVIFDLDDTLYDEIDYCKSGFHAVSRHLAESRKITADKIFDSLWQQFTTGNRTKTFNAALENLGISFDDIFIGKLIDVYRSHTPEITLPPDSRAVLEQLAGKYVLGLLTDGFLPAQQLKVHALGIEKYFKCIIYTEQLGRQFWKPSPAGFQKLLESLNENPRNAVYIADNPQKDFIAPNSLGILTIRIIRPAGLHRNLPDVPSAAAQLTIHKITQLPDLLSKL